jgi:hypothetical protein
VGRRVTVTPQEFTLVNFDAGAVRSVLEEVAGLVGVPDDVDIDLEVDEHTPFGATRTTIAGRQISLWVESGALENPRDLRAFSPEGAALVLGRLLFRACDRLDPAFGAPPPDDEIDIARQTAWDVYAVGRFARLAGVEGGRARRRYAFRVRHGFSDAVDAAFDRLWHGSGLTWADVEAAGEAAVSAGRGR